MRDVRWPIAGLMATATLWVVVGCEGKPSVDSSDTEATVKGVVTINGTPATEGEIVFDPTNYQRKFAKLAVAPIGKDGSYTVKTLTGDNTVTLQGSVVSKNKVLGFRKEHYTVPSGESTFDFKANTSQEPAKGPGR